MASAGASAGRGGRAVPSERAISTFVSNTDSTPDIHRWTEQYIAQAVDHDGGAGGSGGDGGAPFILPIMGLKKVKVPTETVQLQSERASTHTTRSRRRDEQEGGGARGAAASHSYARRLHAS